MRQNTGGHVIVAISLEYHGVVVVKVGKNWCSSKGGFKGFKGRLSSVIPGKVNVFLG